MNSRNLKTLNSIALLLASVFLITSCSKISLSGTPAPGQSVAAGQPGQSNFGGPSIAGYWKWTFSVGPRKATCNVRITQQGGQFTGEGTDDANNAAFNIESGRMSKDGEVRFFKKYPGGKGPPIEYTGRIRMVDANGYKGPYMEGQYVTAMNGKIFNGSWEGGMTGTAEPPAPDMSQAQAMQNPQPQQQEPAAQQAPDQVGQEQVAVQPAQDQQPVDPGRPPHLSGKWNTGYVYHGKTIQGTMYIEQEGGKVWGHGKDDNTKEKFTLKGWYNFPKVTIVRKYAKGKGSAKNKELTFRAKVSVVSDADYQGPYMEGETNLGELWQAQQYR